MTTPTRRKPVRQLTGYWFIPPCLTVTTMFFIVPLLMTMWMSLNNWPLLGHPSFIGFKNYLDLLHDDSFWGALGFTVKYTLVVTPAIFLVAFAGIAGASQRALCRHFPYLLLSPGRHRNDHRQPALDLDV